METINYRIRDAIQSDPRTQAEIARACHVTKATVNDWMQGRTKNIRPDNLFALADALGVSARWLATGQGSRTDPLKVPAIKTIADVLCYTSLATQNAVANMVRQIADEQATYNKN
jgi:transcriptional regulator with XRE-family HTH domain